MDHLWKHLTQKLVKDLQGKKKAINRVIAVERLKFQGYTVGNAKGKKTLIFSLAD